MSENERNLIISELTVLVSQTEHVQKITAIKFWGLKDKVALDKSKVSYVL